MTRFPATLPAICAHLLALTIGFTAAAVVWAWWFGEAR